MNFEDVLTDLKKGTKMTRAAWTDISFVVYQKGYPEGIPSNKQTAKAFDIEEGELFVVKPYLQARTINKEYIMWVPTVEDILADDWMPIF